MISRCTRLRDEQFIAAAEAVARLLTDEERAQGLSLPPLHQIQEVRRAALRVGGLGVWGLVWVAWFACCGGSVDCK